MRRPHSHVALAGVAALGLLLGCVDDDVDDVDTTPPAFGSVAASPDPAKSGDTLTITFTASEPLAADPTVTVDGNAATFVSAVGQSYTYSYVVAGTETEEAATIAVAGDDVIRNSGSGAGSVTLDFTAPVVAVDTLSRWDLTPEVTGTVDDATAALSVTVDGQVNAATNNGDGTWTLADNTLTALALGTYDVAVTATDTLGNAATDATTDELTIAGTEIAAGLTGVYGCSLAWGDYDNDGDLDLALVGPAGGSRIYRNRGETFNTAPAAPAGLGTTYTGTGPYDVTFSWSSATDTETAQDGLSYNLRVGTSAGGNEVFSGMADSTTGLRRIPARGAAQPGPSVNGWTLTLPGDTYYWSVQAVDTGFAGGVWASEKTVTVP